MQGFHFRSPCFLSRQHTDGHLPIFDLYCFQGPSNLHRDSDMSIPTAAYSNGMDVLIESCVNNFKSVVLYP